MTVRTPSSVRRKALSPAFRCGVVDPFAGIPPVLTAGLACGLVHGFPWQCHGIVRVGKANTLVTPNDWSTPGNGTRFSVLG
jgi:hypothetical protein